ncbi:MAG: hypothetical protein NTW87_10080 [Planctomycetota bacterium]|nr:hypothetical protein [Planctomycetota bacterium]
MAKHRKRRRSPRRKQRSLTGQQLKALELFGLHKGNVSQVARAMGRDHKTVEQHLEAAFSKLGTSAEVYLSKYKTRDLSHGPDGQVRHSDLKVKPLSQPTFFSSGRKEEDSADVDPHEAMATTERLRQQVRAEAGRPLTDGELEVAVRAKLDAGGRK